MTAPRTLRLYGQLYRQASAAYVQARQELSELADAAAHELHERCTVALRTEWAQRLRQRGDELQQRSELSDREHDSLAAYALERIRALPTAADVPASEGLGVQQHRPEAWPRRPPPQEFPPVRVRINT